MGPEQAGVAVDGARHGRSDRCRGYCPYRGGDYRPSPGKPHMSLLTFKPLRHSLLDVTTAKVWTYSHQNMVRVKCIPRTKQ